MKHCRQNHKQKVSKVAIHLAVALDEPVYKTFPLEVGSTLTKLLKNRSYCKIKEEGRGMFCF